MPKISVVIPVHNGAPFLRASITSILQQTCVDFEIVVVDDGSTDASASIAETFVRRDRRVVLLRNDRNEGISFSLNHALSVASGKYVMRQDADDIALPHRIERQAAELDRRENAVAVVSDYAVADENGRIRRTVHNRLSDTALRWLLLFHNPAGGNRIMFRRSAAAAAGGFDASFALGEDHDFASRLVAVGDIVSSASVDLLYRQHGSNVTRVRLEELTSCMARITKRLIDEELNRELPDDQSAQVGAVWRVKGGPTLDPYGVNELLQELAERFQQRRRLTDTQMSDVRKVTAARLMLLAITLLLDGDRARAAAYARCAAQWSLRGTATALRYGANRAVTFSPLLVTH